MDTTQKKVREIVASVTGLPSDVAADANLYLDLGVASVHALQLLAELERQFGVSVPDDEFVEATSIAQLTTMMSELLVSGAGESSHA
jgi:acyl carrier protein